MTDQTSEARLAAELQLIYERYGGVNGDPVTWWQAFAREVLRGLSGRALDRDVPDTPLAIGPAADLALAARVRNSGEWFRHGDEHAKPGGYCRTCHLIEIEAR